MDEDADDTWTRIKRQLSTKTEAKGREVAWLSERLGMKIQRVNNWKTRGACPGYVVDHVHPLCAGGPDAPSNMQWQTVQAAKVKDRAERAQCRRK